MFEGLEKKLKLIHKPNQTEPWLEWQYTEAKDIYKLTELGNALTNLSSLNALRQPFFFRGQANSDWRLEPKIYRLVKGIPKEWALRLEYDSIRYFKQQAHLFLSPQLIPKDHDIGAWLALMQQYSAPTRMLDWTTSFYVALYFVVNDEPLNQTGALWFFEVHKLLKWMERYKDIPDTQRKNILSDEEKFVDFGLKKSQPKIDTYESDIKSERMIPQQSVFTYCETLFCDHADLIGHALWDLFRQGEQILPLTKIVVSAEAKKKLREHLNKLNLTAGTLFPGIDGVGRAISEIIRVQRTVFGVGHKSSS
jgi:hypothetical protein